MDTPYLEEFLHDTKDLNNNTNKSESLLQLKNRSLFEHFLPQAMRTSEQMQLNTTSTNMQSKQLVHHNDTISNVSQKQWEAISNKNTSGNGISFQENGMD